MIEISAVNMRQIIFPNIVVILSGSDKDSKHVDNIISFLSKVNANNKVVSIVASAHKNTQLVIRYH